MADEAIATGRLSAGEQSATHALSRRRIGVPDIVFFVVAASSPLTVAAGGLPMSYGTTGVTGVPLIYLILAAVLATFSAGYAAMSRHISNAGAFYSYIAQGLGRVTGVGASFVALVAYNAMQVGLYGLFGFAASGLVSAHLGVDVPWWVSSLVALALIAFLGYRRIDLNAKVLAILLVCESLTVLIFDLAQIGNAPSGLSAEPFTWSALTTGAVGAGFCWVMASFMGFESGAIYSEECRDPRRTVSRATYIAVAVIGVFYAFTAWAMSMGTGVDKIVDESAKNGPDLVFILGGNTLGSSFSTIAQVFMVTAVFAALLSFHNAVARYFFALGREGVLPSRLGDSHPKHGSPYAGSLTQTIFAAVVVTGFGVLGGNPTDTLFNWFTNLGALGVILLLVVTSVSVIGFFRRDRRGENGFSRVIAPALAGATLAVILVLAVVNFHALLGTPPDSILNWLIPGLVLLAGVIGIGYGLRIKARDPETYARIGHGAPVE
ncbi:APC family permease [Microtetraspora sp. NBRC 16547]|uniref:APC family permease n=1 Tax=Microtetraspora sp. NBRC 16547 TaxID=3030993 RepID=UPI0024A4930B|nr:APC family permease [Microtetraspora sp. NBRC 16547]GLW98672.1 amino acid permease [Microtetraspora sp. NBRC 16547]